MNVCIAHCQLSFGEPYSHTPTPCLVSRKSFEFLRDRQRNCQHQLAPRKSLKCAELSVPFAAGISAWIQAGIAEVCFNLNNDLRSQTEPGTFLRVTPLNMRPFHPSDRSPAFRQDICWEICVNILCDVVLTEPESENTCHRKAVQRNTAWKYEKNRRRNASGSVFSHISGKGQWNRLFE